MHIERLKTLADIVERGVVEFPELKLITAFSMERSFGKDTEANFAYWIPVRDDVPNPSIVNSCGCLMGFTILLFSPLKWIIHEEPKDFDAFLEAKATLELNSYQASELFYGRTFRTTTGEEAARVIRKLIMTEEVDWSITKN